MRTYWDTSAVINAAVSTAILDRLDNGQHFTRLHTLAEFFSTMTGRGVTVPDSDGNLVKVVFNPKDCGTWLRMFAGKVEFEELSSDEVLTALDKAQERGVQGPMIYDYFHMLVARKASADEILSRNTGHFESLAKAIAGEPTTGQAGQPRVVWP